jgi:hypothetical protein
VHDATIFHAARFVQGNPDLSCQRRVSGRVLRLAAAADVVQPPLERELVELAVRQAEEQLDAPLRTNALRFSSSAPSTAAGSSTPQCALTGWPGQTGHTSPAALSQTVNTKSSAGAPGAANSSQFLLRSPSVGSRFFCSSSMAYELTRPAGWLPALCAMNCPLPSVFIRTSARIDRAELPVQRKSTCLG